MSRPKQPTVDVKRRVGSSQLVFQALKSGVKGFDRVQDLSAPGMIEAGGRAQPEEYMKYFED